MATTSTDRDWQHWGEQDPYYGVITSAQFRTATMTPEARAAFFETGFHHVAGVLAACRRLLQADFHPQRVLDFGCGVGRLVVPFARIAQQVVGVDVSPAMLDEAARNCDAHGLANVRLVPSDDRLSAVSGSFDLVHSVITLQHIPVARGLQILRHLLAHIAPGGLGAVQLTYGKAWLPDTLGQPPVLPASATSPAPLRPLGASLRRLLRRAPRARLRAPAPGTGPAPDGDPMMLMHAYPLSEVAFLLHTAGMRGFHAEFTDHGGELGVFLYFQRPPTPSSQTPCSS